MDINGKINRGIDLGTTNSAIAVMENGIPVIKKSSTQKDTTPSVVSINRKGVIHTGDAAVNDLASQIFRVTQSWDGRSASTDGFKEFKRTMGSVKVYRSRNLRKDFTSQELSAEIIKTLAVHAEANDGGSIVISVPAKFDATQKDATVEAARLAGFRHVELLQEPIAAAIAFGVGSAQADGFWLVFDFGGGTFDAALLRVDGGVQQVVDTEGNSYLGGKDIDYAIVDHLLLPHVEKYFNITRIKDSEKKMSMLREALKVYAEEAKIALSTSSIAEILSDLGVLGCDDDGDEIELDLSITREMVHPLMEPFFKKAVTICHQLLSRNNLDGKMLTKLILVGGPTYSPYLRQMLMMEISPNIDSSVDPMTAVAKGAALYAATKDIPGDLLTTADTDAMEIDLYYDSMAAGKTAFLAVKVQNPEDIRDGMTVEVVRNDGAWQSGTMAYEAGGIVIMLALAERKANSFTVYFRDKAGRDIKITRNSLTIIQGTQTSAAPLPYHIGFGIWNTEIKRQIFIPFIGLEKSKPLPAVGMSHGRKTTMKLIPGNAETVMKIPVYQAASYMEASPAMLYEYIADVLITGEDVEEVIPAGTDVEVQVNVDSSEMMTFVVSIPDMDIEVFTKLDTSPKFDDSTSDHLITELAAMSRRMLSSLKSENIDVAALMNRLNRLDQIQITIEKKAVVEMHKELLRDIYQLECDTVWERTISKVDSEMRNLRNLESKKGDGISDYALRFLEAVLSSAKANRDITAAKMLLHEIPELKRDLEWETHLPSNIRWYDINFNSLEWKDKDLARKYIDKALEIIKNRFTREEVKDALQKIFSVRKHTYEIREAEGLLS